jgi:hypothetical protein
MAVSLELHNTGDSGAGAEVRALMEHALSDRPGEWPLRFSGVFLHTIACHELSRVPTELFQVGPQRTNSDWQRMFGCT